MMPVFQRERLSDCLNDICALARLHYAGFAPYPDIPFDPNWPLWLTVEHLGVLRLYTVRAPDGTVGGYAVFLVALDLCYQASLQATQSVLYLRPDFRRGLTGFRFLKWCDEQLRAEGVQVVHHHVDARFDFSPLLKRLGYVCRDSTYDRRLDLGA